MKINAFRAARDIVTSRFFRRPFYVHIYLTRRCNLNCRMCNVWQYGNRNEELSVEEWGRIIEILKREGAAHIVITGGESLLYDGILEVVRRICGAGIDARLQSNAGMHVTPQRLAALRGAGLRNLTISLDSLNPSVHDDISRCEGLQRHVVSTLKEAVSIFKDGIVVVNTVVSNRNIAELPEIVSFVTETGAFSSLVPVHLARSGGELIRGRDDSFSTCPPALVNTVYDRLEGMKREGYHILHTDRYLRESRRYLLTGDCSWQCDAGELYFSIFPDGSISICDDFPGEHNILDPSFVFSTFRKAARERRANCAGCIWGCWREASYLVTRTGTILDWGKTFFRRRRRQPRHE